MLVTSVEATIRFITELLGFFLNTTRNMEVSHYIDYKEPSIVSNKEPKIVNLPNCHKEFSLIFKMHAFIVKQDTHVTSHDNGNKHRI